MSRQRERPETRIDRRIRQTGADVLVAAGDVAALELPAPGGGARGGRTSRCRPSGPGPGPRTGASTAPAPGPVGRARPTSAGAARGARRGAPGSPWPGRRGRRTGGRGPAARRTRRARRRRPCRATRRTAAAGRRGRSKPPMCGVIVGSTWSPDSITRSAGSNRQRWSSVWPGVCKATHSRPARRHRSASSRRRVGGGVRISRGKRRVRRIRMRRRSEKGMPSPPHGGGSHGRRRDSSGGLLDVDVGRLGAVPDQS